MPPSVFSFKFRVLSAFIPWLINVKWLPIIDSKLSSSSYF